MVRKNDEACDKKISCNFKTAIGKDYAIWLILYNKGPPIDRKTRKILCRENGEGIGN